MAIDGGEGCEIGSFPFSASEVFVGGDDEADSSAFWVFFLALDF